MAKLPTAYSTPELGKVANRIKSTSHLPEIAAYRTTCKALDVLPLLDVTSAMLIGSVYCQKSRVYLHRGTIIRPCASAMTGASAA